MVDVNVKGGFWGDLGTTFSIGGRSTLKRKIARLFNRAQLKGYRELALTLNGAAAGSAALATHKQVQASEEMGGVRTIETVTDVDRDTVAGDKTKIDEEILAYPLEPSTYPVNGDGNGRQFPGG